MAKAGEKQKTKAEDKGQAANPNGLKKPLVSSARISRRMLLMKFSKRWLVAKNQQKTMAKRKQFQTG